MTPQLFACFIIQQFQLIHEIPAQIEQILQKFMSYHLPLFMHMITHCLQKMLPQFQIIDKFLLISAISVAFES